MLNINPQDVNRLRELLASGQINEADLSGMQIQGGSYNPQGVPLSAQERFAQGDRTGALPMNSMRNESTGQVTYFGQGGGFSDKPYAQAANAQQPRRKVRVVGVGDGNVTELGEEDERALPIDYTRPGINMPGIGRGHYTADGRYAVVDNPDGSRTKVVLGYDAEGSDRLNARALARRKVEADIAATEEQTGLTRDKRQMFAAGPSQTMNDGGAQKPPGKMTEAQAKALGFGMRLANSHEILDSIGQGGAVQPNLLKRSVEGVPLIGGALGMAANAMPEALGGASGAQQQVEQAQRDFINAVLRRESGAVISPEEFANARIQYFPQPGDTPEVIAQKKRNREIVVSAFSEEAGDRRSMIDSTREEARSLYGKKQGGAQSVPPQAVEYLRANPLLKDAFDMKYGRGAAARALGGQ